MLHLEEAGKVAGTVPEFAGAIVSTIAQTSDGAVWAGAINEGNQTPLLLGRFDGSSWSVILPGEPPLDTGGD